MRLLVESCLLTSPINAHCSLISHAGNDSQANASNGDSTEDKISLSQLIYHLTPRKDIRLIVLMGMGLKKRPNCCYACNAPKKYWFVIANNKSVDCKQASVSQNMLPCLCWSLENKRGQIWPSLFASVLTLCLPSIRAPQAFLRVTDSPLGVVAYRVSPNLFSYKEPLVPNLEFNG